MGQELREENDVRDILFYKDHCGSSMGVGLGLGVMGVTKVS